MHLYRFAGVCVLAGLIAACSGQNTTSLLPSTGAPPGVSGPSLARPVAFADSVTAKSTQTITRGSITGISTGKFDVLTGGSSGTVPVTTTGATINQDAVSLATGRYAIVAGSGTSSVTAKYVALFASAPGSITLSGTVAATTAYGIELKTTSYGVVPILLSSSTSGSYTVGDSASVTGNGAANVAILATSVSGSTTTTTTPAPSETTSAGIPLHVVTGDYLGSPWGTTKVSATTASRYINDVITAASNGNTMHAAGLKVEVYMDPTRVASTDPLHSLVNSTAFAKTCSGSIITDKYAGSTQYLMNPASASLQSAYASMVTSDIAGQHVDYIWEDNAGPIEYDNTFSPGNPCGYTDATWNAGEIALESKLPVPTINNGLSDFPEGSVAPAINILSGGSKEAGGDVEDCFGATSIPAQGSWPWTQTEQTQLQVTAEGKYFQCLNRNTTTADDAYASRIYVLASFLMTYNLTYSSLWEEYGTPSGLHALPEQQLVPTEPLVSTPSNISSLERGTDTYVREYKACYYAGKLVGACAMVVNMSYGSEATPKLTQTYHHTLALSGNGVLDGGTASFYGSAPPSTMGEETAFIALP